MLEIEALKEMDHPNICKLYQTFDTGKHFLIILEICSGDLFDVIKKYSKLKESLTRTIFFQIVSAVEYIHSKGYAHRDLKSENVLFDQKGTVKLIDFNLSAKMVCQGLRWNKVQKFH